MPSTSSEPQPERRVSPPRVRITFPVEINGRLVEVELPFVVGVLADLVGHPKDSLKPFKERKFVEIDRDNFNAVLQWAGPRLVLYVPDRLTDPNATLKVELHFQHLDDFQPAQVTEQVPALKELVDQRRNAQDDAAAKEIDRKLSALLSAIMHHPDFRRLEATWRGLHYLVQQTETSDILKIRVLNVSKRDLFKDMEQACEFDLSVLFKKVYEAEFRCLGGQPYSLLVGDYEFDYRLEDVALLRMISNVAGAAYAPFVAAASPKMFKFDSFEELSKPHDLAVIFRGAEYAAWKSFRESEDTRYVALTLPRVLARLPYGFEELAEDAGQDKYLWMSAAWAYATRLTDAFAKYGWLAATRGIEGGGKVEGLPVHTFKTDKGDTAMKTSTEIALNDRHEFELSNLGFLPLLHAKNRDFAAFLGAQSCQNPKQYHDPAANANAELSSKFNYIMCVSRFVHYLKVMARDRIGSFMNAKDCERWLNEWIQNYCCDPDCANLDLRARKPLCEGRIEVQEVKGKPGWYEIIAYLQPHYPLKTPTATRWVAQIPKKS